jgi:hypothetical protein
MTDEAFADLTAALEWGAGLDLTTEQRKALEPLCCKIGGCIPRSRLAHEAEMKRGTQGMLKALEQRVTELERALKAGRQEWVFRRGKSESDANRRPRP